MLENINQPSILKNYLISLTIFIFANKFCSIPRSFQTNKSKKKIQNYNKFSLRKNN